MDKTYILDTFALISYFEGEKGAEKVKNVLEEKQKMKNIEILLCVVNLAEVYYITATERNIEKGEQTINIIKSLPITIVIADEKLSLEAARIKAKYRISLGDTFVGALAKERNGIVLTGDPHFKKLTDEVNIEWL